MIEMSRKLLRVLVENMFIPAMVGTEDIDEVMKMVKEGAVHYVRKRFEADIDLAAMHFGKSTRWIYRVLAGKSEEPGRKSGKRGEDPDGPRPGIPHGYALMMAAVQFFLLKGEPATAAACVRSLRKDGYEISAVELSRLLDMYCAMGYLIKYIEVSGGEQVVRYQAPRMVVQVSSIESQAERLARVGLRSRAIWPIARAYVEGEPHARFYGLSGELYPEIYDQVVADIWAYAQKAIAEGVARTQEQCEVRTDPLVRYRGLFLMGTGPWLEPNERIEEDVSQGEPADSTTKPKL
jgi:hypothetical protein